jgi:hypothetical protein
MAPAVETPYPATFTLIRVGTALVALLAVIVAQRRLRPLRDPGHGHFQR